MYTSSPLYAYGLRRYSSQNGLSNSAILSICQDDDGFMWFGSCDGLNVFDGLNIQVYKPTTETNNLSGNLIEYIHEEEPGILWVQTNYGLDRFDTRRKTIRSFKEFKNRNFFASSGKEIYVIHENGSISYCNSGEEEFRKIELPELSIEEILDFVIDSRRNAWIFTRDGKCYIYHMERNGEEVVFRPFQLFTPSEPLLACFHEGERVYYIDVTHQFYKLDLLSGKADCMFDLQEVIHRKGEVSSVIKHHDDYYMGFKTSGLVRLKETPHSKTPYEVMDIDIKPGIFYLVKDRYQDVIWVGTDGQGVFIYYIDEYSIQSILLSDLSVPVNNPVRALCIDRYRNLWIGTKGDGTVKLSHYDPSASSLAATSWYHTTNSVLKDNSVYAFLPSERNLL
ncbi:MAG: hypothetical protein LUD15_06105 [Bacteroides sp.]|nr:hypothetical protein [Bacteroides sp.]